MTEAILHQNSVSKSVSRLDSHQHGMVQPQSESSDEHEVEIEAEEFSQEFAGDADSLVGFSISHIQAQMRSPTTPAAIKVQAIEAAKDHFEVDPNSIEDVHENRNEPATSIDQVQESLVIPQLASPSNSSQATATVTKPGRSSFVSSILGQASHSSRPRSSSGSSIVESIRKKLPNMPSMSVPKFFTSTEEEKYIPSSKEAHISTGVKPTNTVTPQRPLKEDPGEFQSRTASSRDPRPHTIRRATSDNSLYLRREVTGLSQFDDYNAFSNVSEMVNSRFKAITDSFQDSTFKLPKLPSLGSSTSKKDVDEAHINMVRNQGTLQSPQFTQDPSKSTKHPHLKHALSRMSGDLIVMGGYRGSVLKEAEYPHRQLWVPIKAGMNLRKADLEVGLAREDELRMHERIIPDGVLSHIGPVDICRRLLKKIKHSPTVRSGSLKLHDYGYDWRLSPDILSDRLINYVESLSCNSPEVPVRQRGAWIIAHSLGGLITRHAVNRRPELFAGIVYAGTPQNCVNILGPLRHGDDVLLSSKILTAQVNFTIRTSYALLPEDGRCFINRKTGERYDIDFFDANVWEENRLSPCIQETIQRIRQEKRSSIFESISDVINSSSKQSKLTSSSMNSVTNAISKVEETAHEATEVLHNAAESVNPEQQLSPNMQGSSSQSVKHKPCVATTSTIPLPLARAYLSNTLDSILQFKKDLYHLPTLQKDNAYPPAGIIFAKNTPTVYGSFVTSREAIKHDDAFDELAFAAGDGVVLASAAQLPKGYLCVKNGRVESERGHVGLLGDLEAVGKCLNAVIDAKEKGAGSGAHSRPTSSSSGAVLSSG